MNTQIYDYVPMIQPLDYIFVSEAFEVKKVKALPSMDSISSRTTTTTTRKTGTADSSSSILYPSLDVPSDHLMIAATLELASNYV